MAADVELKAGLDTSEAQKSIKKFSGSATSSLAAVGGSFAALAGIAAAVGAVIASVKLVSFLSDSAKAAAESEDAVQKLNLSLAAAGDYTKQASNGFQKLASDIQKQTGISDELILKQVSLAKAYGLSNAQTEKLVKAAVELSAVTGDDLNASTEKLAKTFNGFQDKSLSKMVQGMKGLTEEQLKNGAAVDLILGKYSGLSANLANTFSGALNKTKAAFGELQESIGRIFTENPVFIKLINVLGDAFNQLGEYFKKNQAFIAEFVNGGIILLLKVMPYVVDILVVFGQVMALAGAELAALTRDVLIFAGAVVRGFSAITTGKVSKAAEELADDLATAAYKAGSFGEASKRAFGDMGKFADKTREATGALVKDLEKMPSVTKAAAKEFEKLNAKPLKIINLEELQKKADEAKQKLQGYFNDPINSLFRIDFVFNKENLAAVGAGLFANVAKGAAGAADTISTVVGTGLATAFGSPALAGPATEIFKILAKGPEEVKKMVTEFIRAIPQIFKNIIKSIPAVIEALIEELPALIDALIDSIPELIDALIDKLPDLIEKLVEAAPVIAEKLAIAMAIKIPAKLIEAIPRLVGALISKLGEALGRLFENVGKSLLDGLAKIPETILKGLGDGIANIFKNIPVVGGLFGGLGGIIGGIGGAIGGIGGAIGGAIGGLFATGGIVPDGFPNDTFKAKLSSGEMVVPRGDVDRLSSFLDRQQGLNDQLFSNVNGGEKNLTVVLNVGESELAKVLLNLNRRGFRTA